MQVEGSTKKIALHGFLQAAVTEVVSPQTLLQFAYIVFLELAIKSLTVASCI
jgi:hypothetical protein